MPACLAPIAGLFYEIVLVDTGSGDSTREIGRRFGARVFDFPWPESFATARNESLRLATGDWIFWLDADDRLDEANCQRLSLLFQHLRDENVCYLMNCVSESFEEDDSSEVMVDHVRLFRNHPLLRWRYRVHEQILLALRSLGGQEQHSDVRIRHEGYADRDRCRGKLERNLRLLRMDQADFPDDSYVLFNLGWTNLQLGHVGDAISYLERSIALAPAGMSTIPKCYALLVHARRRLGQLETALEVCRQALQRFPGEGELAFLEGALLTEAGRVEEAEACLRALLQPGLQARCSGVDAGLRSYKTRHNLAVLYQRQHRYREAEISWRSALEERPGYRPAWLGLGELCLQQSRWEDLDRILAALDRLESTGEAAVLRARRHAALREFAKARSILQEAITRSPRALLPRLVLSYILEKEGGRLEELQQTLQDILAINPNHTETRQRSGSQALEGSKPAQLAGRVGRLLRRVNLLFAPRRTEELVNLSLQSGPLVVVLINGPGQTDKPFSKVLLLLAQADSILCLPQGLIDQP